MGRGPTKEYHKSLNEYYIKGTLTCLKPSIIKREINTDFPKVLNVEPTNRCNLHCYFCPREKAKKGVGNIDWDTYVRIVNEASQYNKLIMLHFHKDGEPFLHPHFIDMVRYAKRKNVAKNLHVNTNALCWTDRVIDEILDSGLDDITVSIDAARPETFKRFKGINALRNVENAVRKLIEKRNQRGQKWPFLRVKIMEFNDIDPEEIKEFLEKWEQVADLVQVTGIHSWSGAVDVEITDETSRVRFPCAIMWYAMVVNWDGTVTFCSVDWNTEICLGQVHKKTLHQIWNSKLTKEARKSQLERHWSKYAVCRDCVVWTSVGDLTPHFRKRKEFFL